MSTPLAPAPPFDPWHIPSDGEDPDIALEPAVLLRCGPAIDGSDPWDQELESLLVEEGDGEVEPRAVAQWVAPPLGVRGASSASAATSGRQRRGRPPGVRGNGKQRRQWIEDMCRCFCFRT